MSKRARHSCPTSTKTAFGDKSAADLALAYITAEHSTPREKKPIRAYRCECRKWHLTSEPLSSGAAEAQLRADRAPEIERKVAAHRSIVHAVAAATRRA